MRNGLFDLRGRTVGLNAGPMPALESLLRLQNTKDFKRPITFYVLSESHVAPMKFCEALLLIDVMLSLHSPVRTVGLGIIDTMQALVLAAGTDKRLLLPNALVEIGDLSAHEVGSKKAISLSGTLQEVPSGAQLHFERLLKRLNLCQELFLVQQTFCAEGAVKHGFADAVYQATRSRGLNSEPPYEHSK